MPTIADPILYEKVKKRVYKEIPKHSAYRSGILVQKYKAAYKRKYGTSKAYKGSKPTKTGLSRWFKEKWRNQRGEVGYKRKGDVYRPTKRITKKTPTTFKELSKYQISKAQKEKRSKGRVKRFKR